MILVLALLFAAFSVFGTIAWIGFAYIDLFFTGWFGGSSNSSQPDDSGFDSDSFGGDD